ncbi:MAG: hypothetical protein J7503_12245 [Cellulomonas iranensis]|uniref:Uncharacterized protein n=1 Tax=Cellulomonas iranensis TaxID=76862 RepID=A0ABU0GP59_9CELL|nr:MULTISPECIES: hypothetical protein [Cellulomonas]MBO9569582.1 hypothetical protein [Cellulomonas iranensis]MDQ0426531.1 hypothetical protein [Cellulomonas iranensis]TFH74185.1 hypothetical protein E4A51_01640 [Cellulomonas sp. HD19AZ1]
MSAPRGRRPPPDEPLGSVVRPVVDDSATAPACHRCADTDLTRVRVALPDGRPAVFAACAACETTAWYVVGGDGRALGPDGTPR